MTAAQIPWQSCDSVHICQSRYQSSSYFFSIFRPERPLWPGGVLRLSAEQARAMNKMTHYDYVKQAIGQLRATGVPITRFPDLQQNSMAISIEGTFLLRKEKHPTPQEMEDMLMELKGLGVSSIALTWNYANPYAGTNLQGHGLTEQGKELVQMLLKHDFLLDLSHTSEKTVMDIHRLHPELPLFFSHSSIRAVCNHPRNISDSVLALVQKTGGLVGINFHAPFVSCQKRATFAQLEKHFAHMRSKIGMDSIALGADLDGFIIAPVEMHDSRDFQKLAHFLMQKGWSRSDVEKIFFQNARIFFEKLSGVKKVHSGSPVREQRK